MGYMHVLAGRLGELLDAAPVLVGEAALELTRRDSHLDGRAHPTATRLDSGTLARLGCVHSTQAALFVVDDHRASLAAIGPTAASHGPWMTPEVEPADLAAVRSHLALDDPGAVWVRAADGVDLESFQGVPRAGQARLEPGQLEQAGLPPAAWPGDGTAVFALYEDQTRRAHDIEAAGTLGRDVQVALASPWGRGLSKRFQVLVAGVHSHGTVVLVAEGNGVVRYQRLVERSPGLAAGLLDRFTM